MLKGINIPEDVEKLYTKGIRFQKIGYMVVRLVDKGKAMELIQKGEKGAEFTDMVDALPQDECCWVFYDFNFEFENRKISRTIMINWIPEESKIHNKMMYSTSKEAVKSKFDGVQNEFIFDNRSEITFDNVRNEILKKIAK